MRAILCLMLLSLPSQAMMSSAVLPRVTVEKAKTNVVQPRKQAEANKPESSTSPAPEFNARDEQVNMILEDISMALTGHEIDEAVRLLMILVERHGDRTLEDRPVTLHALDILRSGPEDMRELWLRNHTTEIARFRDHGRIPAKPLLVFSQCPDLPTLYSRLIPILVEDGDFGRIAETVLVARALDLETHRLETAFRTLVGELRPGPRLAWVLESWMSPLVSEERRSALKASLDQPVARTGDSVRVARAQRPSRHARWTARLSRDGQISRQANNINPYYTTILDEDEFDPGVATENGFRLLTRQSDNSRILWALDARTGKALWRHDFQAAEGAKLITRVSAATDLGDFHMVGWVAVDGRRQQNLSLTSEGMFRDHEGHLLWTLKPEEAWPHAASYIPAGDPLLRSGRLYLPLYDFSEYSFRGGSVYLRVACLDARSGETLWIEEAEELRLQQRVYMPQVKMCWHAGAAIIHTGFRQLLAVDGHSGQVLWKRDYTNDYQRAGVPLPGYQQIRYNNQQGETPVNWDPMNSSMVLRHGLVQLKDTGASAILLVDADTGIVADALRFPNNQSLRWVRTLDDGELYVGSSGGILVHVIQGRLHGRTCSGRLPMPFVDITPWGPGVLINTGTELYEAILDDEGNFSTRSVSEGFHRERLVAVDDNLLVYNEGEVRSLALFPPTFEGIRKLWDDGQRTPELALMLLDEFSGKPWVRQKAFLETVDGDLVRNERLRSWVISRAFDDLRASRIDDFKSRLQFLVDVQAGKQFEFLIKLLNGEEVALPEEALRVAAGHQLTSTMLKDYVTNKLDPLSVGRPARIPVLTKPEQAARWTKVGTATLRGPRVGDYVDEGHSLDYGRTQLIHKPTGNLVALGGRALAVGYGHVLVFENRKLKMYRPREGKRQAPLWTAQPGDVGPKNPTANVPLIHSFQNAPSEDNQRRQLQSVPYRVLPGLLLVQKSQSLSAYDLTTGALQWSRRLKNQFSLGQSRFDEEALYLLGSGQNTKTVRLTRLDLRTGFEDWTASCVVFAEANRGNFGTLADLGDGVLVAGVGAWTVVDKATGEVQVARPVTTRSWRTRPTFFTAGRSRLVFKANNTIYNYFNRDGSYVGPVSGGASFVSWYDRDRILVHHAITGTIELINLTTGKTESTWNSMVKTSLYGMTRLGSDLWMIEAAHRNGARQIHRLDLDTGEIHKLENGPYTNMLVGEGSIGLMRTSGEIDWTFYALSEPSGD